MSVTFGTGPFTNGDLYTGSNGLDYVYQDGCFTLPAPVDQNTQDGFSRQGVSDGTARDVSGNLIPAGAPIITFFGADGSIVNSKDCTDLNDYAILIEAASAGTDDADNAYSAGDKLLQIPTGEVFCLAKSPQADLIFASMPGTDDAGNDYVAGDPLLQLGNGKLICQKKVADTNDGTSFRGVSDGSEVDYLGNPLAPGLPIITWVDGEGNELYSEDLTDQDTLTEDSDGNLLPTNPATGNQVLPEQVLTETSDGAPLAVNPATGREVLPEDQDTLTETSQGVQLPINTATGRQVLPNFARSLNGVEPDENGNLTLVIPADVKVVRIESVPTTDPVTNETTYQLTAVLSDGTNLPFGPIVDRDTFGSVDSLTNADYFIFKYPDGTTAQVCKNPIKKITLNDKEFLPDVSGNLNMSLEILCETGDGDFEVADWDPANNRFVIPFKPQTIVTQYVVFDPAIHVPGAQVGQGTAANPVQIPVYNADSLTEIAPGIWEHTSITGVSERITTGSATNNGDGTCTVTFPDGTTCTTIADTDTALARLVMLPDTDPNDGVTTYSWGYEILDRINGGVVDTVAGPVIEVPVILDKAGNPLTSNIVVMQLSDFVDTNSLAGSTDKLLGQNAAGDCILFDAPADLELAFCDGSSLALEQVRLPNSNGLIWVDSGDGCTPADPPADCQNLSWYSINAPFDYQWEWVPGSGWVIRRAAQGTIIEDGQNIGVSQWDALGVADSDEVVIVDPFDITITNPTCNTLPTVVQAWGHNELRATPNINIESITQYSTDGGANWTIYAQNNKQLLETSTGETRSATTDVAEYGRPLVGFNTAPKSSRTFSFRMVARWRQVGGTTGGPTSLASIFSPRVYARVSGTFPLG